VVPRETVVTIKGALTVALNASSSVGQAGPPSRSHVHMAFWDSRVRKASGKMPVSQRSIAARLGGSCCGEDSGLWLPCSWAPGLAGDR
jgi:hypothetical protein